MTFERKSLAAQQTVGELFVRTREARGWTLEEAAKQAHTPLKYLEALEHGRYDVLEAIAYARQYAKAYANALRVPWTTVEPIFNAETELYHPLHKVDLGPLSRKTKRSSPSRSAHAAKAVHILPRLLSWGSAAVGIMVVFIYIAFEISRVFTPPPLVILAPEHDMIVTDREFTLLGNTAPEAIVTINGERVDITTTGDFTEKLYLHEGLNTIRISTRSERSQEREEVRHILYTPENQ